jgi:hypothetical protein
MNQSSINCDIACETAFDMLFAVIPMKDDGQPQLVSNCGATQKSRLDDK